jgi:hypothetical protein
MTAPTAPAGTFRTVLTLPVVKSSAVGKGDAWSVGRYKRADSSVTIQLVPGKRTVPVCSSDAHSFTMSVPLSAPIGSRSILQQ